MSSPLVQKQTPHFLLLDVPAGIEAHIPNMLKRHLSLVFRYERQHTRLCHVTDANFSVSVCFGILEQHRDKPHNHSTTENMAHL